MPDNNDNIQNPFTPFTQAEEPAVNEQDIQLNDQPTDTQAPKKDYPQDERIVDYLITKVIPAKHPEMAADQLVAEKDRLYKILENGIFETAYSQLTSEQKDELDSLMKYGANIPAIQAFFIEKIPDIQMQLGKYMETFVENYLKGEI